ncbi:MAG TPA: GDP-mannose 4,6-dehydratase [Myxococcales bacterium]|jgi:GDP-4-dehydro-6-deoxy-D-mannose reductase|nr:GDP-mannose 4,6-dehydratase [Myxococcales bacterium]
MRILITGITGFAGSHLAELALTKPGVEVFGTCRTRSRLENVKHLLDDLVLVECDLRDPFSVQKAVKDVLPDRVFHLAAQSFVPTSWSAPDETLTTNIVGQLNLLEAIRHSRPDARVQVACSSEEYGLVHPHEVPLTEHSPLRPLSPYAVSKVGQDMLAYQYFASYGLFTVRTRAFNHTGPRRGEHFVTSSFARQIAEIEAGLKPAVLRCGNLDAKRDFTDVRDMVEAYWLSLEHGDPGEVYVIASGHACTIRELLDMLLAMARCPVTIETDPERLRPSDVQILEGDATRFRARTGWEPKIPFAKTLSDLLDFWRARLSAPASSAETEESSAGPAA